MPIPGGDFSYAHGTVDASTLPAYDVGDTPFDLSDAGAGVIALEAGISFNRGRADESATIEPGQLSFTAEYRSFTRTPTADILASDWVQLTEAAHDGSASTRRFRGKVDTQTAGWPPTGNIRQDDVTVTDRLAALSRHTLRSMTIEELALRSPLSVYALDEPQGSTEAGDSVGSQTPLTIAGSGAAPVFGVDMGLGLAGVQFSAGKGLIRQRFSQIADPTRYGLLVVFSASAPPGGSIGTLIVGLPDAAWGIQVDTFGDLITAGAGSPVGVSSHVTDGQVHVVLVSADGTTVSQWLDGVLTDTAPVTYSGGPIDGSLRVGTNPGFIINSPPDPGFTGLIAHVAEFPGGLTNADAAAISDAFLTAFAGETTADRAARIASYAGITAADTSFAGTHIMAAQETAGVSVLDALQACAVVEHSQVYIDGSGVLTMRDSHHRTITSTSAPALVVDLDDQYVESDLAIAVGDKQYLENRVTGTRDGGAQQQLEDADSIAAYDVYPKDLGTVSAVDDQTVLNLIDQELIGHAQPVDRISTVTLNLMSLDDVGIVAQILALELGDRLQVTGLPSTAPFDTADLIVEGIAESRDEDQWTITFNVSPAAIYQRFILGDPTFGVLGSDYRLAY